MGYYMGDGAVMGLSEPTVTGAGSNAGFVTFKRDAANRQVLFYYIEKRANAVGEVSGPYTAHEYSEIQKAKPLPPYTWNTP